MNGKPRTNEIVKLYFILLSLSVGVLNFIILFWSAPPSTAVTLSKVMSQLNVEYYGMMIFKIRVALAFLALVLLFTGLFLGKRPVLQSWSSSKLAMLCGCTFTIVLLIVLELCLSPLYPPTYRWFRPYTPKPYFAIYDNELGYRLNSGKIRDNYTGRFYLINSSHFRGEEIGPKDKQFRIVCLGDSITFGWCLMDSETYPVRLEEYLNSLKTSRRYEVINAGTPGYTSEQLKLLLKRSILNLKPDMVIICAGWNDFTSAFRKNWTRASAFESGQFKTGFEPAILAALLDFRNILMRSHSRDNPFNEAPSEAATLLYQENLRAMIDLLRDEKIQPVLVNLPTSLHIDVVDLRTGFIGNKQKFLHEYDLNIHQIASEKGVPFVPDLFDVTDPRDKRKYFFDHCHFSPDGSIAASRIIGDFLKTRHLTPDR